MRLLRAVHLEDSGQLIRVCAQWLREDLGLKVVEYRIGNAFTGSIDILAVDAQGVHLVTVNTGRLGDALLEALTGYRWFLENRGFLQRVYGTDDVDLMGQPALVLLSSEFPPEIRTILVQALKVEVRLFRYLVMGTEENPEFYAEELTTPVIRGEDTVEDLNTIRKDLGIEEAGLDDDEIRDFLSAVRGP